MERNTKERVPTIERDERRRAPDAALEELLTRVYVGGGYTAPEVAATALVADAVRARGRILWCPGGTADNELGVAGLVVLVLPTSPARRLAAADEAELHLLAVDPAR